MRFGRRSLSGQCVSAKYISNLPQEHSRPEIPGHDCNAGIQFSYLPAWVGLSFNGTDLMHYSTMWIGLNTTPIASQYYGWGNSPSFTMTGSQVLWTRVQYDGTTLTAWQLAENPGTVPSASAWAAVASSPVLSTTAYSGGSGGLIGLQPTVGGYAGLVTRFTLNTWDSATSAYDITAADESFGVDSSGYADDTLTNDQNGNLTYDGVQVYTYDAWNRLKTVAHGYRDSSGTLHSGQVSSTMSYDARGRRIIKAINGTGPWDCTYNYYLDGDSVVEERNGSNQWIKQMVWGLSYIDDLIQVSINYGEYNAVASYWACQDANWNVLGLVNNAGMLMERYQYTPYGQRQVYTSGGSNDPLCYTPILASQRFDNVLGGGIEPYGLCEFGHQGLMQDEESGLVYVRHRYLQPVLGRWMQQDPIRSNRENNLYHFLQSSPIMMTDPEGLCSKLDANDGNCPTPWKAGKGRIGQYGCYCGEGQAPGSPKPIDALDKCCQEHDACYGPPPKAPKAQCDATLCQCARDVNDSGQCYSPKCEQEVKLIDAYFCK